MTAADANTVLGVVGTAVTSLVGASLVVHGTYAGVVRRRIQRSYRSGDVCVGRPAVVEGTFRILLGGAILALNLWLVLQ